ncbi:MAG: hypothetical protein WA294_22690 [Acidobacteriaceae bacterium]
MRRPAGVIAAAVVLGLIALVGIFAMMLALGFAVFVHNPILPSAFRPFVILFNGLGLCFFLFCAWVFIDLLRMRNWARISAIILGALIFLFSALAGVGILLAQKYAALLPQGPNPIDMTAIFIGIAVFYFLFALIGVWWIVYFTRQAVCAAFRGAGIMVTNPDILPPGGASVIAPAPGPGLSGWRIVIIVWACLMLISVLSLPIVFVMHTPLFLFGMIVTGPAETAILLVLAALEIFLGIGLLRKWKPAWYVALLWQLYTLAFALCFLIPGMRARFVACEEQAAARWMPAGTPQFPSSLVWNGPLMTFCFVLGMLSVVLCTVALFRRKEDYLGA